MNKNRAERAKQITYIILEENDRKKFVCAVCGYVHTADELAACAKKNGLDAIHNTVHEMARDEARHGRGLKGLLERYFK